MARSPAIELMHTGPPRRLPLQPRGADRAVPSRSIRLLSGAGARDGQAATSATSAAGTARPRSASKKAGFDIVYVYATHDLSLVGDFLSRRRNDRTDEYGGSLENRARLLRELIEDTKEAVGDSCAVAVRFAVDELIGPDGEPDDGGGARRHRDAGRAAGSLGRQHQRLAARFQPSRFAKEGFQEEFIAFVKKLTTQAGGRRRPLHLARHDGVADQARHPGLHRRGAALDRRSVPAEEDRGRPHRRHPRMHRLQHLRAARLHHRAHALHAEPDHGRGMAQGLASGDHPAREGPTIACWSSAPGPAGLECARALGNAATRCIWPRRRRASAAACTQRAGCPALPAWAPRARLPRAADRAMPNVTSICDSKLTRRDVLEFGFQQGRPGDRRHLAARRRSAAGTRCRSPAWQQAGLTPDDSWPDKRRSAGPVVIYDDDHYYMGGVLAEKLRLRPAGGHAGDARLPCLELDARNTLGAVLYRRALYELGVTIVEKHSLVSGRAKATMSEITHAAMAPPRNSRRASLLLVTFACRTKRSIRT